MNHRQLTNCFERLVKNNCVIISFQEIGYDNYTITFLDNKLTLQGDKFVRKEYTFGTMQGVDCYLIVSKNREL